MKHLLLIPLLFSLAACDQWKKLNGINDTVVPAPAPVAPAPQPPVITSHITVAFAGQSNMLAGTGLSDEFTSTLRNKGIETKRIECAVGGTSIAQWQKGQPLYDNCMAQMRLNPPDALLFWQGEADSASTTTYITWGVMFSQMVQDLRSDLGYKVPILFVRISNQNSVSHPIEAAAIRDQQTTLLLDRGTMFSIDPWDSYIWSGHEPHYTREGYETIGRALGQRYMQGLP